MALRGDRLRAMGTLLAAPLAMPDAPARLDLRGRTRQRSTLLAVIAGCLVVLVALGAIALTMSLDTTGASAVASGVGAGGTTSAAGTSGTSGAAGTTGTGSVPTDPVVALESQRQTDLAALSDAEGVWLPQLSSKRVGTRADGRVYDASAIWSQFEGLKARYPQVRLVWSGDWGSFRQGGYWVVLVDSRSAIGSAANAWCDAEGFPADACYAKRLSQSGGFAGNTIPRN